MKNFVVYFKPFNNIIENFKMRRKPFNRLTKNGDHKIRLKLLTTLFRGLQTKAFGISET